MAFDSDIINAPIIYTKIEVFIWLLIKKNKYSNGGLEKADKAIDQVDLNLNL